MVFRSFIFLTVVISIAESDWYIQELYADKNTEVKQSKLQSVVNSSDNNKDKNLCPEPLKHLLNSKLQPKLLQHLINSTNRKNYVLWPELSQHLLKSSTKYNYIFWLYLVEKSLKSSNRDNYISRPKRSHQLLKSSIRGNYIFWPSLSEHSLNSFDRDNYTSRLRSWKHLIKSPTKDSWPYLTENYLQSSNRNNVSWPKPSQQLLKSFTKDKILSTRSSNLLKSFNRNNFSRRELSKRSLWSGEECECGTSAFLKSERLIINGHPLHHMKEYPFLVSLHATGGGWGFCGGSIISPTFILSAAHCAVDKSFEDCGKLNKPISKCRRKPSEVLIGILGRNRYHPAYKVPVKRIIINPKYQMKDSLYDLALFELKRPLPCTDYSRPICLASKLMAKPGEILNIVGAGGVKRGSIYMSDEYHHGTTYVVKTSNCNPKLHHSILCAQGVEYGACDGDSGSSAFIDYLGRYYSIGLTSTKTSGDCDPKQPVIYTRISYFYPFIAKHVKNLPKPKRIHNPYYRHIIIGF